jgi:Spy/CpxP family protein refolding chaperone
MLNKSRILALTLLLAIGAAGFFSGHATGTYRGEKSKECARRGRPSYSGLLQDSLGLTDAQRDTVQAILIRHRSEMNAVFESVRPRMDSLRLAVNNEIAAALPADKRDDFAAFRDRMRAERARRDSMHRAERERERR